MYSSKYTRILSARKYETMFEFYVMLYFQKIFERELLL